MKLYIFSLGAGLLVGIVYSLLSVRSPAPPLIALIGLLGILVGEQIIPVGKQLLHGAPLSSVFESQAANAAALEELPAQPEQAKARQETQG